MDAMKRFQCDAGFWHNLGEDCGHPIARRSVGVVTAPAETGFSVPDDYYSPEVTAARKAANRARYTAGSRVATRVTRPEVNHSYTVDRVGGQPHRLGDDIF